MVRQRRIEQARESRSVKRGHVASDFRCCVEAAKRAAVWGCRL